MSSKNNGFTASDIERYHSGKMSPAERHALEKAALDDPFMADALEGYAFTSTPAVDLTKIQSRLDDKVNQKKVIPLFQKYRWLSVAALFVIIAGAGWLVYTVSEKESQQQVAVQNEKESRETESQQLLPDTNSNSANTSDKKINDKQEVTTSAKKEIDINKAVSDKQSQETIVISNTKKNQSNAYQKNESNSNSANDVYQNRLEGKNARIGNVQPVEISRNATASDTQKRNDTANIDVTKADANNNIAATTPGIRVRGIEQSDSVKHLNIVLQQLPKDSQPALEEVVVEGYGAQKKSMDRYPKVTIDTLEPAEGYVKFDDYVISNLQMPDELKTKSIAGEVQLAFDVDQNGKPTNITVVKSLCEKCDEEAIRLLKEGPKWKKKKNKKGKITIKF
jgi:TonB family protein